MKESVNHIKGVRQPDTVSRHTLELTFRLLRREWPALALAIQNILVSKQQLIRRQQHKSTLHNNCDQDFFQINLDAQTIGKIVSALTELGETTLTKAPHDKEKLMFLKTLIDDWIALAEWLMLHIQIDPDSTLLNP